MTYVAEVGVIWCLGKLPPRIEVRCKTKLGARIAAKYYAMLIDWLWLVPPFTFHCSFSRYRTQPVPSEAGIWWGVREEA